jgi:hypothetical protein
MTQTNFRPNLSSDLARLGVSEPDFAGFDSAADIIRDAAKWGLLDDLRNMLCGGGQNNDAAPFFNQ